MSENPVAEQAAVWLGRAAAAAFAIMALLTVHGGGLSLLSRA